jgi:hypothetical protein
MGTISFLLPENLSAEDAVELDRACIVGGPDNMPWPSKTHTVNSHLTIRRAVDESGFLVSPLPLGALGRMMISSSTLMERAEPYELLVELARGKTNQVRMQYHDWCMGGLQASPDLEQSIRTASHAFGEAILADSPAERQRLADSALGLACRAADCLVKTYVDQVFAIRHQRQHRLDTQLGCRLGAHTRDEQLRAVLGRACNSATIDFSWRDAEPSEGRLQWDRYEALLEAAGRQGIEVQGGPLIDFSPGALPDWLALYEKDAQKVATLMSRYVEAVLRRFGARVRRWELCHGSNWASVLRLNEDDLFWLTVRLIETARAVDPAFDLSVGLVQPWGEYMAVREIMSSPVDFADKLVRAGINLAWLGLEVVMGIAPRGTYCRDALELSRLIDLYAQFGIPLQIDLGFPSAAGHDPLADPGLRVGNGNWHGASTPELQAEWAAFFAALALSKPSVYSVQWVHLADDVTHQFPHCGLVDAQGRPKPAVDRLQYLREQHLM